MNGFYGSIEDLTLQNTNFRKVIFTGKHAQLVLMNLLPGEEIGMEVHDNVDQFFRFEEGEGKVVIDGEEAVLGPQMAVVVPAGSQHNIINTSAVSHLKLYTIYSPPNHPEGTIQATKAEADEAHH